MDKLRLTKAVAMALFVSMTQLVFLPQNAWAATPGTPATKTSAKRTSALAPVTAASHVSTAYLDKIKQHVLHYWYPPAGKNARVTVRFRVHADGKVSWLELENASSVAMVNDAATDAILMAVPYPKPDDPSVKAVDVEIDFQSHNPDPVSGYSRPSPDMVRSANALLKESDLLIEKNQFLGAIEKLEEARQLCPFDARVRDKAISCCGKGAEICGDDEDLLPELLHKVLYLDPENKNARQQLTDFHTKHGHDGKSFEERLAVARRYSAAGKPLDALVEYREASLLDPHKDIIPDLAVALQQSEGLKEVRKWQQIVNRYKSAENLVYLAAAYRNAGNTDQAERTFEEASALDPVTAGSHANLLGVSRESTSDQMLWKARAEAFLDKPTTAVTINLVKNRQPNVDYFAWACGKNVHRWTPGRFPLKLYVETGYGTPGYRPQFNKMVVDAFKAWTDASQGRLSFLMAPDKRSANVVCKWSATPGGMKNAPPNAQGVTLFQFVEFMKGNRTIRSAEITILTLDRHSRNEISDQIMAVICLHEVGHALGISGHSPYDADIMYPALNPYGHYPTKLSVRDCATIKHLYQGYEIAKK